VDADGVACIISRDVTDSPCSMLVYHVIISVVARMAVKEKSVSSFAADMNQILNPRQNRAESNPESAAIRADWTLYMMQRLAAILPDTGCLRLR